MKFIFGFSFPDGLSEGRPIVRSLKFRRGKCQREEFWCCGARNIRNLHVLHGIGGHHCYRHENILPFQERRTGQGVSGPPDVLHAHVLCTFQGEVHHTEVH